MLKVKELTNERKNPNGIRYTLVGDVVVSTVRLHTVPELEMLPFETMVFNCDEDGVVTDWMDLDVAKYDTREEAIHGHEEMVEKWLLRQTEE